MSNVLDKPGIPINYTMVCTIECTKVVVGRLSCGVPLIFSPTGETTIPGMHYDYTI
ncbi:hypothetical protein K22PH164C1_LOCUS12 [Klebsiella phage vB_Kpn_K22PH164C1]|uniref:Uncharacterized protein n=1 Tax=Klebsiella phage vB_Kpn_K22PH164C1 TaxID=3071617 RepID=A0AAV1MIT3_9CAUD|nr:hypothetical protein K22PH164C1_LOCUS12 [Klebsiella phage vB_Kpn_K22PH164C1]